MKSPLFLQNVMPVVFLALLSGCSSNPEPSQTVTPQELVQIKADIEELKKMKPGLQRMTRMEGDLKNLIGHLNSLVEQSPTAQLETANAADNVEVAKLNNREIEERQLTNADSIAEPEPATTPDPAVAAQTPVLAEAEKAEFVAHADQVTEDVAEQEEAVNPSVSQAIETNYSVQLASITNPSQLSATWSKLQKRYPAQLSSLQPVYEKQLVASRQYYRVKAGSFASYEDASTLCGQLISRGASCIVGKSVSNYYTSL